MTDQIQPAEDADLDDATPVAMEIALDQRMIPFLDAELIAALTTQGDIYINLPGMCRALGLDSRGQLQRIRRRDVLERGLRRIPLETPKRGRQLTYCLRVDKLGLWLGGMETKSLDAGFRDKIIAYQEELAPIATRLFLRLAGGQVPSALATTPDPRLVELAEQHQAALDVAQLIREHMDALIAATNAIGDLGVRLDETVGALGALAGQQQAISGQQQVLANQLALTNSRVNTIDERTAQLSPQHKRQVRDMVEQIVRATKGLPAPLTYSRIYGRLKYRFQVASYAEIADEAFETVMQYLKDILRAATSGQAPQQDPLF
ncbi:MAG TPA: phage antirepressor N-terminal domain-containing protein [Chloroflexia bacterium]|nr:phage antirepressor N-terminal domain-containing protein [Chloroflexia bacterium]